MIMRDALSARQGMGLASRLNIIRSSMCLITMRIPDRWEWLDVEVSDLLALLVLLWLETVAAGDGGEVGTLGSRLALSWAGHWGDVAGVLALRGGMEVLLLAWLGVDVAGAGRDSLDWDGLGAISDDWSGLGVLDWLLLADGLLLRLLLIILVIVLEVGRSWNLSLVAARLGLESGCRDTSLVTGLGVLARDMWGVLARAVLSLNLSQKLLLNAGLLLDWLLVSGSLWRSVGLRDGLLDWRWSGVRDGWRWCWSNNVLDWGWERLLDLLEGWDLLLDLLN